MKHPFREHHLLQILSLFEGETLPLDVFLRNYFRVHTAVGSKDRKEICETLYTIVRWHALLETGGEFPLQPEPLQKHLSRLKHNPALPEHVQVSFPEPFYQTLVSSLGREKALEFCHVANTEAPTTIRVNTLLTSREALLEKWRGVYAVSPCIHSPVGIRFEQKINFFSLEEFKAGHFEVQDEASQLIADLVAIQPGERFLDYCSGSGGKSLSVATKLQHKGQLFLHDIRPSVLLEARGRLKRAHIQNAQPLPADSPNKQRIKGKMDWVLVDAPCSGTGTLRRNPDMKWKWDPEALPRLVQLQRLLVQEALSYVKPGGHLVYATCSVMPQENEEQMTHFLSHLPLELAHPPFSSFPQYGAMDGFFGVVFKKKRG